MEQQLKTATRKSRKIDLVKKGLKIIGYSFLSFVVLILIYIGIALLLSNIEVNKEAQTAGDNQTIYLKTNGVHLDIILKKTDLQPIISSSLNISAEEQYLAFGWGDENFYLHTPTWNDLTFKTAFGAMFLKSSTLVHLTKYSEKRSSWVAVNLTSNELEQLKQYLVSSFNFKNGKIQEIEQGYSSSDSFYKATGNYSIFKTCNTWANKGFNQSGLKSCVWTPFDFGLLDRYK